MWRPPNHVKRISPNYHRNESPSGFNISALSVLEGAGKSSNGKFLFNINPSLLGKINFEERSWRGGASGGKSRLIAFLLTLITSHYWNILLLEHVPNIAIIFILLLCGVASSFHSVRPSKLHAIPSLCLLPRDLFRGWLAIAYWHCQSSWLVPFRLMMSMMIRLLTIVTTY